MNTRRIAAALCLFALVCRAFAAAPTEPEALTSAETWLALVDNKQYADSWKQSGSQFRARVTQRQWIGMVGQVRSPLGALKSPRSIIGVKFARSLPGAPDGDYAIVQFRSAFEHKAEAVETVTLVAEAGILKCVGYFIQ